VCLDVVVKGHERFGWTMFTLSGVFFLIVAIQNGDWLTGAGAVVWMLGCLAFLLGDRD
jgi:hypothetical protein